MPVLLGAQKRSRAKPLCTDVRALLNQITHHLQVAIVYRTVKRRKLIGLNIWVHTSAVPEQFLDHGNVSGTSPKRYSEPRNACTP